jgi:uracil-DNA glycosylase family 4
MTFFTRNEIQAGLNLVDDSNMTAERLNLLGMRGVATMNLAAKHPTMPPSGSLQPVVYMLGDCPDQASDDAGKPFSGNDGQLLRNVLREREMSVMFDNIVRTIPKTDITFNDIECFRPSIVNDIEKYKPKVVMTLGQTATKWALGKDAVYQKKMLTLRGRAFPCKFGTHVCYVLPTYHPFTVQTGSFDGEREVPNKEFDNFWQRDIESAFELAKLESPASRFETIPTGKVEYYWKGPIQPIIDYLTNAKGVFSVDIETNGLRPYKKNSKILSVAVTNTNGGIAFALDHKDTKYYGQTPRTDILSALYNFLLNPDAIKVYHNAPFEMEWFGNLYSWRLLFDSTWHDTIAAGYVLDCRQGGLSLDFLCKQTFGLDLKKYSKVDRAHLEFENIEAVLHYNGFDPIYTAKLWHFQQQQLITQGLLKTYNDQIQRMAPFVVAQMKGFPVNQFKVLEQKGNWERELGVNTKLLNESQEIKNYVDRYGHFDYMDKECMERLFVHTLGRGKDCTRFDKAKNESTVNFDKKSFEAMSDLPIVGYIQKAKKAEHMLSTYVLPLTAEFPQSVLYPDGKVHFNFTTTKTETRRISCLDPNGQNQPPEIRKQFEAPKGYVVLKCDYGQQEFRCLAMASEDAEVIKYIKDGIDIHMDWATRVYNKYPKTCDARHGGFETKEQKKLFRSEVKNQFVFAAFYLSTKKACANRLEMPVDVFTPIFNEFWEQFFGVRRWQEKTVNLYKKYGYVESLTGFRRYGPLSDSMIVNTPIQGLGSDILIDGQNRLAEIAYREDDENLIFNLNVHDDNTFILPINGLIGYKDTIVKTLVCSKLPFINVPLEVEASSGPNWFDMTKIGVYRTTDFVN